MEVLFGEKTFGRKTWLALICGFGGFFPQEIVASSTPRFLVEQVVTVSEFDFR